MMNDITEAEEAILKILELALRACEGADLGFQLRANIILNDPDSKRRLRDRAAAFGACQDTLKECIAILRGEEVPA